MFLFSWKGWCGCSVTPPSLWFSIKLVVLPVGVQHNKSRTPSSVTVSRSTAATFPLPVGAHKSSRFVPAPSEAQNVCTSSWQPGSCVVLINIIIFIFFSWYQTNESWRTELCSNFDFAQFIYSKITVKRVKMSVFSSEVMISASTTCCNQLSCLIPGLMIKPGFILFLNKDLWLCCCFLSLFSFFFLYFSFPLFLISFY